LRIEEAKMAEDVREVRREADFDASPAELWEAVTDERLLSEWLADEVELDPVEGAPLRVREGDEEREGVVTRVEEERVLSFEWERPGSGVSEVELIVAAVSGGSRLVVVERAVSGPVALAGASWRAKLTALATALTLVAA
jgi:uncharacterized protein YndB with AHSA1/START domain